MTTTVYSADEINIEGCIIVPECPITGEMLPSRLENCIECKNLFGFAKNPAADSVEWEYKVICAIPLQRRAIKVR